METTTNTKTNESTNPTPIDVNAEPTLAQQRFIQLRAQGWTYARLAAELDVHRNTLVNWSRKFQFEIQNQKTIEAEALAEQCFTSRATRWQALADQLNRLETEINQRDLANVPTHQLYILAARIRREIQRETRQTPFTLPITDIPAPELHPIAHDWTP